MREMVWVEVLAFVAVSLLTLLSFCLVTFAGAAVRAMASLWSWSRLPDGFESSGVVPVSLFELRLRQWWRSALAPG
ncbi:hypothetical protein Skr01_40280 [Sphaerisporangium krabiense]|nr:hypothetical protein Skr01_40280 [Sphaerisporangium krabiense]